MKIASGCGCDVFLCLRFPNSIFVPLPKKIIAKQNVLPRTPLLPQAYAPYRSKLCQWKITILLMGDISSFVVILFIVMLWVWPPPSNSDRKDYSILGRGSQPKPLKMPLLLAGGQTQVMLVFWLLQLSIRFRLLNWHFGLCFFYKDKTHRTFEQPTTNNSNNKQQPTSNSKSQEKVNLKVV